MSSSRFILLGALVLFGTATHLHAQRGTTLSYLGTAGWEMSDGQTVVLIDPYLSRLKRAIPDVAVLKEDPRPTFTNEDLAKSDERAIDAHIQRANYILITHTHYDHSMDMPYIARKTGATVIGTESTVNFARASGVADAQLIAVKGGEDYQFNTFSVRVIPSLHGLRRGLNIAPSSGPALPSTIPVTAKAPFRVGELLVEGGTLAYLVRFGGRQILAFGSMNYIEREVDGLRPDVVLVGAMPERSQVSDYTGRLLRLLGYPSLVLPTHWDNFYVPFDASQEPAIERLQSFIAEVKAASPKSRVVVPEYFRPIPLDTVGR